MFGRILALLSAPATVATVAGGVSFYRQNRQVNEFIDEAQEEFGRYQDTAESHQQYTQQYLPPLTGIANGLQFTDAIPNFSHQDFSHSVMQSVRGGRFHTTFMYPQRLFRQHYVEVREESPDIVEEDFSRFPHLRYLADDLSLLRHRMETFINYHESTHAAENHPAIMMTVHSSIQAFQAGVVAFSARMVTRIGVRTLPGALLGIATGVGVFIGRALSYETRDESVDNRFFLETRMSDFSINPSRVTDASADTLVTEFTTNAVSRLLESRADDGAIQRTLQSHSPEEALEILRAAEAYLCTEVLDEGELNDEAYHDAHRWTQSRSQFFHHTHPHPFRRIQVVREAIRNLEAELSDSADLQARL